MGFENSFYLFIKFKNVEKVTNVEPNDKEILSQIMRSDNIYRKLVLHLKFDTQAYYNIRIILGLDIS